VNIHGRNMPLSSNALVLLVHRTKYDEKVSSPSSSNENVYQYTSNCCGGPNFGCRLKVLGGDKKKATEPYEEIRRFNKCVDGAMNEKFSSMFIARFRHTCGCKSLGGGRGEALQSGMSP